MTTPAPGYRVIVRKDDGSETDVTEGVKALYDHTINSMDWGSGFLELDDAREIIAVALACGFLVPETAQKEFETYAKHMQPLPCAVCGVSAFWHYGGGTDAAPAGWYHGVKPQYPVQPVETADHPVRLWADAPGRYEPSREDATTDAPTAKDAE